MKKIFLLLLFVLMLVGNSRAEEDRQFIDVFGFVLLDEQGEVDIGRIFFGRLGASSVPRQHLAKGESVHMFEHHASRDITYLGQRGNQVVFKDINRFNAISFGGNITEEASEITITPYTFEQFVANSDEKEIVQEVLLDTGFYLKEQVYLNWLKKWLEEKGIEKKDEEGNTFLLNAINKDTIQFLLDSGANINATNDKGENILMRQITRWENGKLKPEMLRFLLERGIDKNHRNLEGKDIKDIIVRTAQARANGMEAKDKTNVLSDEDKINLEILIGKENCSGVYDEKTRRCLDCFSPEIFNEHIAFEAAKELCVKCVNRSYQNGRCYLDAGTK